VSIACRGEASKDDEGSQAAAGVHGQCVALRQSAYWTSASLGIVTMEAGLVAMDGSLAWF